jgi:hypothetical protein
MATQAKYLPSTISRSPAGMVKSNSSVPSRRSSAHTPMVMAGTKIKRISVIALLSTSRLQRLALKNSLGRNAAPELSNRKTQMKT